MFSDTQFGIESVPSFDTITGLSPTVAVEQRTIRQSNPRSTVGTRTKLSAILAMLFTNYGVRNPKYDDGIPLSMEMFQRNSAKGMCAKCIGKGSTRIVYEDKIYGDAGQKLPFGFLNFIIANSKKSIHGVIKLMIISKRLICLLIQS